MLIRYWGKHFEYPEDGISWRKIPFPDAFIRNPKLPVFDPCWLDPLFFGQSYKWFNKHTIFTHKKLLHSKGKNRRDVERGWKDFSLI